MNKTIFVFSILALLTFNLKGQINSLNKRKELPFQEKIFTVTTLLKISNKGKIKQGTGFFFTNTSDTTKSLDNQENWLVTNRHILYPNESYPDYLIINIRKLGNKSVEWKEIKIKKDYLKKYTKFFNDSLIDIAVLNISIILKNLKKIDGNSLQIFSLSNIDLINKNSDYIPEVGDDVLVIGYPKGYYDFKNKFPIVKSGIIASQYGWDFNGKPNFLIDCKLFPGSSGSLVLLKPQNLQMIKGHLKYNIVKHTYLLGVYSGEYGWDHKPINFGNMIIKEIDQFNTGIIWYGELIEKLTKPKI